MKIKELTSDIVAVVAITMANLSILFIALSLAFGTIYLLYWILKNIFVFLLE